MKKNITLTQIFSLFLLFEASAQIIGPPREIPDEIVELNPIQENSVQPASSYQVQTYIEDVKTANSIDLQNRLNGLQRTIALPYNQTVHGFIDFFIFRKPSYTKLMLERQMLYFPTFEKYLAKYNLPDELKYLSIVESGLNPKAKSKAKAVGLWQFMKPTGNEFGLSVDQYIDERMHIEKSTEAACKYLSQLYRIFGDWHLALAAYNTGPGNVRKAIRKSGGITDFWAIYPNLHRETRSYVPQFVALTYMMNHANDHGIYAEKVEELIPSTSVYLNSFIDLTTFSNLTNIGLDEIKELNPHIQKDILPASIRNFELKIPTEKFVVFDSNRQMILDSASKSKSIIFASEEVIVDGVLYRNGEPQKDVIEELPMQEPIGKIMPNDPEEVLKSRKVKTQTYVVQKGDNLFQIAERFNVEVYDLKQWNELSSSKIMLGQKLKVHADEIETSASKFAKRDTEAEIRTTTKTHIVQRGDTLWSIAQQYGGLSIEKLKRLNNLPDNTVKAGQKIKLG
jgi:membrane-bound lytic murein transglycosylase D